MSLLKLLKFANPIISDSERIRRSREWLSPPPRDIRYRSVCQAQRYLEPRFAFRIPKSAYLAVRSRLELHQRCIHRPRHAHDDMPPPNNLAERRSARQHWEEFPQ